MGEDENIKKIIMRNGIMAKTLPDLLIQSSNKEVKFMAEKDNVKIISEKLLEKSMMAQTIPDRTTASSDSSSEDSSDNSSTDTVSKDE